MSLYDKIDETLNEQMLMEMAQVGTTIDSYNVYVYSIDNGVKPHFHYASKDKNFHTCIEIQEARYFLHGNKRDILNNKQLKNLIDFLEGPSKLKRYDTNWELIKDLWNLGDRQQYVSDDQQMPDYENLK